MDCKIKISVIIYVKNGFPYITQCLKSIMNQTLREIEIIVVDAGSSDGTYEYLLEKSLYDNRIRVITSIPSVGKQFNKALSVASGDYIAICEADDYVRKDAYENLYRIAENTGCDVIRADYNQFFGESRHEIKFRTHACSNQLLYNQVIKLTDNFFLQEGINGFWSGLYRKKFLLDNDIKMSETPGASYQDVGFSFQCQCLAKSVFFVDDVYYQYRLDNPYASMNVNNRVGRMIKEFESLEYNLILKNIWNKFKRDFFSWEIEALKKAYISAEGCSKESVLDEIQGNISAQLERNGIKDSDYKLISTIENFIVDQDTNINRLLNYFDNIRDDERNIIIFGAGFLGQVTAAVLCEYGKNFEMADNCVKLQGLEINGHVIQSPQMVVDKNNTAIYLVANVNHAYEIQSQLIELGISIKNIIICNNDELLLRKILISERKLNDEYGRKNTRGNYE